MDIRRDRPSLKYRLTRNQKSEVEKIDLPKEAATVNSVYLDWICDSNGFLGMILDPLKEIDPGYRVQMVSGTLLLPALMNLIRQMKVSKPANLPGYMTLLPLKNGAGTMKLRFFAGPFDSAIFKEVDESIFRSCDMVITPITLLAKPCMAGSHSFPSHLPSSYLF